MPEDTVPAPRTSSRPPHVPVAVQVLDQLGDIAGVVAVTILAIYGKVTGVEALVTIGAILGVQTGLRRIGTRNMGVVGLTLLAMLPAVATLARVALATIVLLAFVACGPKPRPRTDAAVVSSWTDTARMILNALGWILPAARGLLAELLGSAPIVGRAIDATADAAGRLRLALDAYETRGGDRCAAHAAAGGVGVALVQLAQVLADHGLAIGRPLERVADSVAALADTLVPACQTDAGWASAGDRANAGLRAIEASAAARGAVLRRDLDNLAAPNIQ